MGFLGILTLILRTNKCINMEWKTAKLILVTKLHKKMAYGIIFLTQITISLGVMNYFTYDDKTSIGWILISCSNVVFFSILICSEVIYRRSAKIEVQYDPVR